jgi:hypothetical protein
MFDDVCEYIFEQPGDVTLRGSKRITFLINWWNTKPLGPNCNKVS